MTDNVENLILEHLRNLRNEVRAQGVKMDEQFEGVRLRLSSMENQLAGLRADVAGIHLRMDKFETRMDRIERRLELREEV